VIFSYHGRSSNKYLFRVSSAVSDIGSASDSPRATVWGPQDHEILSDNKPIDSAGHCRLRSNSTVPSHWHWWSLCLSERRRLLSGKRILGSFTGEQIRTAVSTRELSDQQATVVGNRHLKTFPILPCLSTSGFVFSASSRMRAVSNELSRA
jgi:hypothetical protein